MSEQRTRRLEIRLSDPQTVSHLLEKACATVDDAEHAFLTSRDGMVVASDTAAGDTDLLALRGSALAAAAAGIGDNFARISAHGRLQSALFESDRGTVGVFPVSSSLLLVVSSSPSANLGRLSMAAKKITGMLLAPQE